MKDIDYWKNEGFVFEARFPNEYDLWVDRKTMRMLRRYCDGRERLSDPKTGGGYAKVPPERSLSTVEDIGEGRRERPRKGAPCERDDSSRNCDSESCVWFAGSCCRATSGSESTTEPTPSDAPSSSAGLTAGECCRASSTPISAPERTAIPECPDCHQPMGRWGWYESDAEPVEYWYCYQCDRIRILPAGRPIVLRKEENDA